MGALAVLTESWRRGVYRAQRWKEGSMFCARCLYSLMHGHLAQAFSLNPVELLVAPWLVFLGFGQLRYAVTGARARRRPLPAALVWVILGVIVSYWIACNLPWYPFSLLAPGPLSGTAIARGDQDLTAAMLFHYP